MNNLSHTIQQPASPTEVIRVTDRAKARLKRLLDNAPEGACAIAVTLTKGGCTGFIYAVEFVDHIAPGSEVVHGEFGTLVIAPAAVLYLLGATMDFEETDLHNRFVFDNPNESSRCGCGLSIKF